MSNRRESVDEYVARVRARYAAEGLAPVEDRSWASFLHYAGKRGDSPTRFRYVYDAIAVTSFSGTPREGLYTWPFLAALLAAGPSEGLARTQFVDDLARLSTEVYGRAEALWRLGMPPFDALTQAAPRVAWFWAW